MNVRIYHVSPDGQEFAWDGWCECQECRKSVAEDGTVGVQHVNSFAATPLARLFAVKHYGIPEGCWDRRELAEHGIAIH